MDRLLGRKSSANSSSASETSIRSGYSDDHFQKISAKQLARYFNDFQMRLDPSGQIPDINFDIEVFHTGNTLYKFEASDSTLTITASGDLKNDVIEVVDRSGIYNLEVEFNPAPHNAFSIDSGNIILADGDAIPIKNRTDDNNFSNWFSHLCLLLGEKIHLIPDSNFFRRCYYTNYMKAILNANNNKNKLLMKIPRLEIIEVENKFSTNRASKTPERTSIKLPLQFANKAAEEKTDQSYKETRVAFNTIVEILSMKNNGAEVLPSIDMLLLRSFTPLAGRGLADSWIRREISDASSVLAVQDKVKRNGKFEGSDIVLLTCDLMNAFAAIAENLNTFYLFRIEEDRINLGFNFYTRLALLIINTAIQFEQCDCVIKAQSQTHKLKFKGVWKGKSVYDWQSNAIFYDNIR
jgi:hypothetical protein